MPNRFKWILHCLDNGSTYTLQKDPVGWDSCSYRMERHQTYKGIFNQFTSNLKFHRMGGGKQWVDNIYKTFDIDAQVTITVMIDADGNGSNYDTLFTGRLNFAAYSEDGTYTTLNIEQSDIFTKLNTRADIAVPVNILKLSAGIYQADNWVPFSFYGTQLDSLDNSDSAGSWLISNAFITQGHTYYVQTPDVNGNNLTCKVIFDGITNNTNGIQTDGTTQISIHNNIAEGFMQVDFVNPVKPLTLYLAGNQQMSLGQQPISTVPSKLLTLPGIPVQYESQFTLTNSAQSDFTNGHIFDGTGKYSFTPGSIITATTQDYNGALIYDQITYTGPGTSGSGMLSGATQIRIKNSNATSVTVVYLNAYGPIDLFVGSIGGLGSSPGTGSPTGQNIDTYQPVGSSAAIQFNVPDNGTIPFMAGNYLGGFFTFDGLTVFDNLNNFILTRSQDIGLPNKTLSNTSLTSIFSGFTDSNIQYPVLVTWAIDLKGKFTENLGLPYARNIKLDFTLAYGGGATPSGGNPLTDSSTTKRSLYSHSHAYYGNVAEVDFDTGILTDTFILHPGDQIWLYAYVTDNLLEGGVTESIPFIFTFDKSNIDFKIITTTPATTAQSVFVHEAFNQVVDSIADSDRNFYSEFYGRVDSAKLTYANNGPASMRALTNGLCIRGHLDKYINLSLNDIFNSMSAIDNIGLEIDSNNRVRVEPLAFYFDRLTQIAMLPNVNRIEVHNENSYYINQVEVGYDKWETELYFKNALNEVHAKRMYATKVGSAKGTALQNYGGNTAGFLKVSGKLGALSKFIAGNYTIELTRRKNLQWSQDDFKYDNDNFIICTNHTYNGLAIFGAQTFLDDPQMLKMPFTPAILGGDTFTITNTTANNGTYTIAKVEHITGSGTFIHIAGSFHYEIAANANMQFINSLFAEQASSVLQQPVQNTIDASLTNSWLNMTITPGRMLQAHMNKVTAGLQIIKGKTQFLGGSGNFEAATQMYNTGQQQDYKGRLLYENASLNYNDPNVRNIEPLWLPEIYRFEYPITYNVFKQIKANPNGYIAFYKFSNDVKFGFILSMDYEIKTGNTKFELLRMNPPAVIDGLLNEDGTFMVL